MVGAGDGSGRAGRYAGARELLELTRGAYTDGVQAAALVSAAILAVLAVTTATLLRSPKRAEVPVTVDS
ncbi:MULTISPECIES: hypothetical protein [Kribbella]|uniref:hypothetical protein n=1 Tax=Kribbella TaxID=182639 RepID=UPI001042D2F6|nr:MULTISPECIES: hypothetical protein [Kribbella]